MTTTAKNAGHEAFNRLAMNRMGLWVFIVSDASFFAALLTSRFFVVGLHTPEEVDQILGLGLTIVLLVSSLTAYRAEKAAQHGDLGALKSNMLLTMLFGVLFLAGVGYEWQQAFIHFPPHTAYGTILFTMTGVHATHVFTAVIALGVVYMKGRDGHFGSDDYWAVEGVVKWWHFVDVAWVFIYPTLYLISD